MGSPTLGTWLGALALGGVLVLYVRVDRLADRVRPWAQERSRPEREPPTPPEEPQRTWTSSAVAGDGGEALRKEAGAAPADPGRQGARDAGPSLEERVARLEERAAPGTRGHAPWGLPRFASTVDQLAKDLGLSAAQQSRVEDAIRRGTQRIEDVLRIPDADGRSPWERRQERRQKLSEALGKGEKSALLEIGLSPLRERETRIPGRETTYGEEIDRIRAETRSEIESQLSPEQREEFGDMRIDPLLGEHAAVSFAVVADASVGAIEDAGKGK